MSSPSIVFIQKYHSYYSDNFKNTNLYKSNPKKYDLYMKTSSFYRCKESFDVCIMHCSYAREIMLSSI